MFEKIDAIIKEIEAANEEIQILLSMAKISFIDYVMIKRGSMDMPEHVGAWSFQQIDMEVNRLKEQIDALNKIKKEILVF